MDFLPDIIVLAGVILLTLLWARNGVFSGMLGIAYTLAAAAIALSLWDPIGNLMVNSVLASDDTFWLSVVWGTTLIGLYVVTLGILAGATNALIRGNAALHPGVDVVGGLICGLVISTTSVGIFVIGASYIRTGGTVMGGYSAVTDESGSPVRGKMLWYPADRIVAEGFKFFSKNALSTSTPLAAYFPDIAYRGHKMRMAPEDVPLKFAFRRDDVKLVDRFVIEPAGDSAAPFLKDTLKDGNRPHDARRFDGTPYSLGKHRIHGITIEPSSSMREAAGNIMFGAGHITLVARDPKTGNSQAFSPISVISQGKPKPPASPEEGAATEGTNQIPLAGRWRFDSAGVFYGTVGSSSGQVFGFEFLVPAELEPLLVDVRGVRIDLTGPNARAPRTLTSVGARDREIESGRFQQLATFKIDLSKATKWEAADGQPQWAQGSDSLGFVIPATNARGLELTKMDNIQSEVIARGDAVFSEEDLKTNVQLPRDMQVQRFFVGDGLAMVQVDVSSNSPFSIDSALFTADAVPGLSDGTQFFPCVGFLTQQEGGRTFIRYTPDKPIQNLRRELNPFPSKSRQDLKTKLLFLVSVNTDVKYMVAGSNAVKEISPPIRVAPRR